jgi:hypothetical protein
MAVTEEDVRRAYYANAGAPATWWITEMQMNPTRLIVADESDGNIYQVPFSIGSGGVQFAAAQPVGSYADVAATAGGTAMVYASAEESRSVMDGQDTGDTGDAGEGGDGGDTTFGDVTAQGGDGGTWDGEWETELEGEGLAAAGTSSDNDNGAGDPTSSDYKGGMTHPPFTGKHAHPHAAYGDQGDDDGHDHMHTHDNDSMHDPGGQASPHTHGPKASSTEGESDMEFSAEQLAGIRLRLGKRPGDEISGADIAAAITQAPQFAAAAGAGVDGGAVPEVGDGAYLVDGSVIREWQQRAAAGDHAVNRLRVSERDTVLASAMEEGKFPQARLDHYKSMWDRDPDGTRRYVDTLASGFVVPMGGKGTNGAFDPDMGGDFEGQDAYRTLYPEDAKGGVSAAAGIPGGRR